MKTYIELHSGNFEFEGMVIPASRGNRHYSKLLEEVESGQAKITAYVPETQSQRDNARNKRDGSQYLASTDWYVIRKMEKGTPIPANITSKRDEARGKADKS